LASFISVHVTVCDEFMVDHVAPLLELLISCHVTVWLSSISSQRNLLNTTSNALLDSYITELNTAAATMLSIALLDSKIDPGRIRKDEIVSAPEAASITEREDSIIEEAASTPEAVSYAALL